MNKDGSQILLVVNKICEVFLQFGVNSVCFSCCWDISPDKQRWLEAVFEPDFLAIVGFGDDV